METGISCRILAPEFKPKQTNQMRIQDTILYDKRYRREYSNKTYGSSKGQKTSRAMATTDRLECSYSDRIERADEQRNNRRRARA